jgi:hypothetical protein
MGLDILLKGQATAREIALQLSVSQALKYFHAPGLDTSKGR